MGVANLSHELIDASRKGDLRRVEELIHLGANPNMHHVINRSTALQNAAGAGYLEIVKLLVQNGAEIDAVAGDIPHSAIESAALAGHLNIVEWLVQNGSHVPSNAQMDALLADLEERKEYRMVAFLRGAQKQ